MSQTKVNALKLYPALDLMNGSCVRLRQGQFDRSTIYGEDPLAVVKRFIRDGAEALHIVDLEGARDPGKRQRDLLKTILAAASVPVQVGGGVRSLEDVEDLLSLGATRVVIGSLAIQNIPETKRIFDRVGAERVTLALDVVGGAGVEPMVAVHGWAKTSALSLYSVLETYRPQGLRYLLCTDIERDGMLNGPNGALYGKLRSVLTNEMDRVEIQASGGVKGTEDLRDLRARGIPAVILGRSLYEGTIDLADAIREMKDDVC